MTISQTAFIFGQKGERLVGGAQRDFGRGALEVVALADLLARLVQRVVHFREVDGRRDVERGGISHGPTFYP
jgi:hypothetical protein